jgi:hypothetical protein
MQRNFKAVATYSCMKTQTAAQCAFVGFLMVFFGCTASRVTLREAPTKEAALEVRMAAYEKLKPVVTSTAFRVTSTSEGAFLDGMLLSDGTFITDPRDLVPVVDKNSASSAYIESYAQAKEARRVPRLVSQFLLALGGGGVVATVGAGIANQDSNSTPIMVGAGITAACAFIAAGIVAFTGPRPTTNVRKDQLGAFQSYRGSLLKRLDLKDPLVKEPEPPNFEIVGVSRQPLESEL